MKTLSELQNEFEQLASAMKQKQKPKPKSKPKSESGWEAMVNPPSTSNLNAEYETLRSQHIQLQGLNRLKGKMKL